jgi:hypothetical protein
MGMVGLAGLGKLKKFNDLTGSQTYVEALHLNQILKPMLRHSISINYATVCPLRDKKECLHLHVQGTVFYSLIPKSSKQ